jgi:hypothetical protein
MPGAVGGRFSNSRKSNEGGTVDMGLDELLKRVGDGFFGVLFITNKNSDHNIAWHFLGTFITTRVMVVNGLENELGSFVKTLWVAQVSQKHTVTIPYET